MSIPTCTMAGQTTSWALTLLLLVIVMAWGWGIDTSTGTDSDARNAPTHAVSSSKHKVESLCVYILLSFKYIQLDRAWRTKPKHLSTPPFRYHAKFVCGTCKLISWLLGTKYIKKY